MTYHLINISIASLFLLSSASAVIVEDVPSEAAVQQEKRLDAIKALKDPKTKHGLNLLAIAKRYRDVQVSKKYQENGEVDIAETVAFYRALKNTIKDAFTKTQSIKAEIKKTGGTHVLRARLGAQNHIMTEYRDEQKENGAIIMRVFNINATQLATIPAAKVLQ